LPVAETLILLIEHEFKQRKGENDHPS
jgi:hypothetical protein